MSIAITYASPADAAQVAGLAKALTDEICTRTGITHFDLDLTATGRMARELLEAGHYRVLLARDGDHGAVLGFATLCESHALYAGGCFGIIQEFYVLPDHRSQRIGAQLLEAAAGHARQSGWKRLELCTPPLPAFDRTLAFYRQNGYQVTGGRKMKLEIAEVAEESAG